MTELRKREPSRSVLIVDDDRPLRTQLVRAFRDRGWEARGAATVDEAVELAAESSPEHAVVDLRIGDGSGLTVVRDLKRIDPTICIVVLTGYGSIATATKAVRLGAIDYLTKPADCDDLLAAFAQTDRPVLDEGFARGPAHDGDGPLTLAEAEWEHINRVLSDCSGNITRAAEKLGIHRRSLQRKLQRPPR